MISRKLKKLISENEIVANFLWNILLTDKSKFYSHDCSISYVPTYFSSFIKDNIIL